MPTQVINVVLALVASVNSVNARLGSTAGVPETIRTDCVCRTITGRSHRSSELASQSNPAADTHAAFTLLKSKERTFIKASKALALLTCV